MWKIWNNKSKLTQEDKVKMITPKAFENISSLLKVHAGIHLNESKKQLVIGRLSKRLRELDVRDFDAYYEVCVNSGDELQTMINTLTTNETSFFREAHHFEFMRENVLAHTTTSPFRVWSAAASIGAEAYSIAMQLDELLSPKSLTWEVIGTDINTDVLKSASKGLYDMRFSQQIPQEYLRRYCLRGVGANDGKFLVGDYLREKVHFLYANLMLAPQKELGKFDIIFLRNMLIYFNQEERKKIVQNVLQVLKPQGYLFIGHAETITHLNLKVRQIRPTIYKNGV